MVVRDMVVGATAMSGLLAGASLDRYLVQVPAWRVDASADRG